MSFIPKDEEHLEKSSQYFGLAKATPGSHRIRILSAPINGRLDWLVEPGLGKNGKDKWTPIRTRPTDKRPPLNPKREPLPFWSMVVWNYDLDGLYIWDLVQGSVIKQLKGLCADPSFGDCRNYDIKVLKKVSPNGKPEYTVLPLPPTDLDERVQKFYENTPIRLEALYENKDPFKDLVDENGELPSTYQSDVEVATFQETTSPADLDEAEEVATLDMITSLLTKDGIETSKIEEFIKTLSLKLKKTQDQIIENFVMPETYPTYKKHYEKYLAESEQAA